jgi:hypothetical protein
MDSAHKPAPEWKAPETLLPRVMAAVAQPGMREVFHPSPAARLGGLLVTAGLCACVALAGAILIGLFPYPILMLESVAHQAIGAYQATSALERVVAHLVRVLLSNQTSAVVMGIYCLAVLAGGLGSLGGLACLLKPASLTRSRLS